MNKRSITFMTFAFLLSLPGIPAAQEVTKSSGGSIQIELGQGYVLNAGSSLSREWITIHDDSLPADIMGTVGLKAVYEDKKFKYRAQWLVQAKEPISAIEVMFLTFDIWGNHVSSLSTTDVTDRKPDLKRRLEGEWYERSESRISEYYASIAYIARVRTADGRVIKADPEIVLKEARKFSEKFSKNDLEPSPEEQ